MPTKPKAKAKAKAKAKQPKIAWKTIRVGLPIESMSRAEALQIIGELVREGDTVTVRNGIRLKVSNRLK